MSDTRATRVTHLLAAARGETRAALRRAPKLAPLLVAASWGAVAILMGSVAGFAAVTLPLQGLAGIVAVFVVIFLWVLPETPAPSDILIRRLFFIVLVVDLALPHYYAIQLPGTPWISAGRLVTFAFISLFALAYSMSQSVRARISEVIGYNKALFVCVVGFLFMIVMSIFTSVNPIGSLSSLWEVILEWYIPFIAVIYVIRDEDDIAFMIRVICICALIVSAIGIMEPIVGRRIYAAAMPQFMYENIIAGNPDMQAMLDSLAMRNGQYRGSSLYTTPLSFAEFEAMIAPLGAIYFIHGRSLFDRVFGIVVIVACLAGIWASASRGGYLAFLAAGAAFTVLFVVRTNLFQPRSLATPIFGLLAGTGLALVTGSIFFVGRISYVIFAGAEGESSNAARVAEWMLAWPSILSNPVTGHGFSMAGAVVGYRSSAAAPLTVDSFLLSLIVETGLPSVVFFFGAAFIAIWVGSRQYLRDQSLGGVLAGGLACSIIAFASYRFFLSQRENQTLFFVLLACVALLHAFYVKAGEPKPAADAVGRPLAQGGPRAR